MSAPYRIIHTNSQEEWLEERRSFVTASEIGQLAQRNQTYWDQLAREKATGERKEFKTKYTEWGHEREPVIIEWVQNEADPLIVGNDQLYVSTRWPKYAATPDGIRMDGAVTCQVKTSATPMSEDTIPQHYYDQVQWELMVVGAEYCIFAVEQHENFEVVDTWYTKILADPERQAELRTIAERFLDGGFAVDGTEDEVIAAALDEWAEAEEHVREAKARALEAKEWFQQLIQDSEETKFASTRFQVTRIPASTRRMLDTKQLKTDHPDVFAAYQVEKQVAESLRAPRPIKQTENSNAA